MGIRQAPVAQLAEHRSYKPRATGSSPVGRTLGENLSEGRAQALPCLRLAAHGRGTKDPLIGKRQQAHTTVKAPSTRVGEKQADLELANLDVGGRRRLPSSGIGLTMARLIERQVAATDARLKLARWGWLPATPESASFQRNGAANALRAPS